MTETFEMNEKYIYLGLSTLLTLASLVVLALVARTVLHRGFSLDTLFLAMTSSVFLVVFAAVSGYLAKDAGLLRFGGKEKDSKE